MSSDFVNEFIGMALVALVLTGLTLLYGRRDRG